MGVNRNVVAFILKKTPCKVSDLPDGPWSGKKVRAALTHLIETRQVEIADGTLYQMVRKSIHPPPPVPRTQPLKVWSSPWHAVTLNRLPLHPSFTHLLKDDD